MALIQLGAQRVFDKSDGGKKEHQRYDRVDIERGLLKEKNEIH